MHRKCIFILVLFTNILAYAQEQKKSPGDLIMDSLFRAKEKESLGKPFPEFTAKFNTKELTKDSLKGKIVFINFWFEACPPCIAELPALTKLYYDLKDNKDFEFLSFTHESPARIKILRKKYHLPYKIASVTNQECYRLNQNNGFPTSIVLDRNGNIYQLFTGGDTDKKVASRFIKISVYTKIKEALAAIPIK